MNARRTLCLKFDYASPADQTARVTDSKTVGFPGSILKWLSAGYPEGIPPKDRFPLIALLGRTTLTTEQVRSVVLELVSPNSGVLDDGSIDTDEISTYIRDPTHAEPSEEDIARVASRLAAGGWPLADPTLATVTSTEAR